MIGVTKFFVIADQLVLDEIRFLVIIDQSMPGIQKCYIINNQLTEAFKVFVNNQLAIPHSKVLCYRGISKARCCKFLLSLTNWHSELQNVIIDSTLGIRKRYIISSQLTEAFKIFVNNQLAIRHSKVFCYRWPSKAWHFKFSLSLTNQHSELQNYMLLLTCFMFLLWPTILLAFYGLSYYFSIVLRAASTSVYSCASVYTVHCACVVQVRSHLSFF